MLRASTTLASLAAVGLLSLLHAGCGSSDDPNTGPSSGTGAAGSTSGTGGTSGSGGSAGNGGGGGAPAGCIPSDAGGRPVDDDCGLFVSSSLGDDANPGTKDKPYKTINGALLASNGKPVYVCAETDAYQESLLITTSVGIFGGLDCANMWSYDAAKPTALLGSEGSPAVVVTTAELRLEDFDVTAQSATDPGKDSIGILGNEATLELTRVAVTAGDGADGMPGTDGGMQAAVDPTMNGEQGAASGTAPANAAGGVNACGGALSGGVAGKGGDTAGTQNGETGGKGDMGAGASGGLGQVFGDVLWTCATGQGASGTKGANGVAGAGGKGLGVLTELGVAGRDAEVGGAAMNGTSAGGGGGSAAATSHGAGGGGGAAAGCAGAAGGRGGAGGSSIGIATIKGSLSLLSVTVTVGKGASGAKGGAGQLGQLGGTGGPGGMGTAGVASACPGGDGGAGGDGGNAGGGAGGHAIGVAHSRTMLNGTPSVTLDAAIPGMGGLGGDNGADPGGAGDPGTMIEVQPF